MDSVNEVLVKHIKLLISYNAMSLLNKIKEDISLLQLSNPKANILFISSDKEEVGGVDCQIVQTVEDLLNVWFTNLAQGKKYDWVYLYDLHMIFPKVNQDMFDELEKLFEGTPVTCTVQLNKTGFCFSASLFS